MEAMIAEAGLEQRIQWLEAFVTEQSAQIASQAGRIAKMDMLIQYYEEQLLLSKRRQFGPSSEHLDDCQQLNLFNEAEALTDRSLPEPELEEITYQRRKQKGKREQDLSGLPVERTEYELPPEQRICPECGGPLDDIGVHVHRELKLQPAKVIVEEQAVQYMPAGPVGRPATTRRSSRPTHPNR